MKFLAKLTLVTILICAGSISSYADQWNLVLLVSSDMEGQLDPFTVKVKEEGKIVMREVGGFARLAWAFSKAREKYPGMTLTVSSGDDLLGPYFSVFKGKPIYEAMNKMGYDVGALGNHEFDRGDGFLAESLDYCRFPIVESNLQIGRNSPLFGKTSRYAVLDKNGLKIGVFGLVNEDLALISKPGPEVAVIPDLAAVAREMVGILVGEQGVDLVVALAHIGLQASRNLAREVPEIDVICVGNDVTLVEKGRELVRHPDGGVSLVVQSGEKGEYLGLLKLSVQNRRIADYHWQPIHMDSQIPKDRGMADLVLSYNKQLPPDKVLAETTVPIDIRKESLRTGEAPMGSLVADILKDRYGTDLALYNGGGIRGNKVLPAGEIRSSDIDTIFPFGDMVILLKLPGRVIEQALERGVAALPQAKGPFLQVSGIRYTININRPSQQIEFGDDGKALAVAGEGERIQRVEVLGDDGRYTPLDPDREYMMATNQFLAEGGDGYVMLKTAVDRVETDTPVRSLVAEAIEVMGVISPKNKDRIDFVTE